MVFFFRFSRCMVIFLRNHLNFQNLFVWTNTNMISVSYQKLWIPKKSLWTCAIMHSFGRKWKHNTKILGAMVSCLKVMLDVLFAWNNNKKWRHVTNTGKTHDLISKKDSFDRGSLVALWAYQQDWNRLKQKIKFCRHDRTEAVMFWQNKNMLHSATVVQFPFDQPSHKSFCRNAGLCWGSWPCLPPISSGWVIAGVKVGWKELPQRYF
jgi:hypothetical protein